MMCWWFSGENVTTFCFLSVLLSEDRIAVPRHNMAKAKLSDFFNSLARGMAAETLVGTSDQQLVEYALAGSEEAPFQAILHRHGPMVYRVCWRVLQHSQDAEDAFQTTFLILAQRLQTLRKHASLASWLHGVAYRVALKAKAQSSARRLHEQRASKGALPPRDDLTWRELHLALDLELKQLPEKWRQPLILCYLEGRTQDEAASELGWSTRTLRRRLEEGRDALGKRLKGRGLVWSAAISAVLVSDCMTPAAVVPQLVVSTVEAVASVVAGKPVTSAVSAKVAALTQGMLKTMFPSILKKVGFLLFAVLGLVAIGGALIKQQEVTAQLRQEATDQKGLISAVETPNEESADQWLMLKESRLAGLDPTSADPVPKEKEVKEVGPVEIDFSPLDGQKSTPDTLITFIVEEKGKQTYYQSFSTTKILQSVEMVDSFCLHLPRAGFELQKLDGGKLAVKKFKESDQFTLRIEVTGLPKDAPVPIVKPIEKTK
jgi:RNA polymerase sigma factor (sigma-70 family)